MPRKEIMSIEIYKSAIAQNRDQDVPEFGRFVSHELRRPDIRRLSPDLFGDEALKGLRENALRRALYFGYGVGNLPPVHFPNAEHFQHIPFTHNHWLRYGNMESECSRVRFMLERYQSRQFPAAFGPICRDVLNSGIVLQKWNNQIPKIDKVSRAIYEQVAQHMKEQKAHDDLEYGNGEQGAYQSAPVFYEFSEESGILERELWREALVQISKELQDRSYRNLPSFLHLYNRVKDPVTPLRSILPEQVKVFRETYEGSMSLLSHNPGSIEQQQILISQLALESSFLALPGAKDISFVVYGGHHELPYIYLDIAELPRGEFAGPRRVIEVLDELIDESERCGQAVVTPITVSYCQEPFQSKPSLFIVDGNNRATAILLMKFINFASFKREEILDYEESLRRFIVLYDLDIKWERDLAVALKNLSLEAVDSLLDKQNTVQEFAYAHVPALLVQEPNFHTVAVTQSHGEKIVLLQPMHQAIYNQERLSIAIPAKQQSHGRATGNDIRVCLKNMVGR